MPGTRRAENERAAAPHLQELRESLNGIRHHYNKEHVLTTLLKTTLDVIEPATIAIDMNARVVHANPSAHRLLGTVPDRTRDTSLDHAVLSTTGRVLNESEWPINRVLSGEVDEIDEDLVLLWPDRKRIVTLHAHAARNGSNELVGAIVVFHESR